LLERKMSSAEERLLALARAQEMEVSVFPGRRAGQNQRRLHLALGEESRRTGANGDDDQGRAP
jgi:hypothetical protein